MRKTDWAKKLRRAARHVGHAVHKVTHGVEKAGKKVIKETTRFIHHSKSETWAEPIKIGAIDVSEDQKSYNAKVPMALGQQMVKELGVDKASLNGFLKKAQFATSIKTLLNTINFDKLADVRNRIGDLQCVAVKSIKQNGEYKITAFKVRGKAQIWANNKKKTTKSDFGIKHSHKSESWRPLTSDELTQVYNTIVDKINPKLNAIKQKVK